MNTDYEIQSNTKPLLEYLFNEFQSDLFDMDPVAYFIYDSQGTILEGNQATKELTGYSSEELIGRSILKTISPVPNQLFNPSSLLKNNTTGKESEPKQFNLRKKDGTHVQVGLCINPIQIRGETVILCIARVIPERKDIEAKWKRQQEHIHNLFNEVLYGIVMIDAKYLQILDVNRAAEYILGKSKKDLTGKVCHDVFCLHNQGHCPIIKLHQNVDHRECAVKGKHGKKIPIVKSAKMISVDGRDVILESFMDISDRKELESRLVESKKMESIGQLAAGIAHEINNPLQFILGNIEFIDQSLKVLHPLFQVYRDSLAGGSNGDTYDLKELVGKWDKTKINYVIDEMPKSVNQSIDGINRITDIIGSLKSYSNIGVREKRFEDLNEAIVDIVHISKSEWKMIADVEMDLDCKLPRVWCNVHEIIQVLLNLLMNASHAISKKHAQNGGEKGKIRICSRNKKDHIEIQVQDSGTGIPADIQNKIFDPFFTTKNMGEGIGQGLYLC
ncbi:hypothetical protein BVY01_00225, partial [bacterium I07]